MVSSRFIVPVLLVALAGCASARPDLSQHSDIVGNSWSPGAAEEEPAADIGHIACERDSIRVDTPVVRAHADGVRVVFENPGAAWGFEFHPVSFEYGQGMGDKLPEDVSTSTWTIPPGEVIVACVPNARSSYFDPDATSATLTVVDPGALFVSWNLPCGFGDQFRFKISAAENDDPAEVFRLVPGVQVFDELKKPGYPESPLHWPTFMVFREGQAVARIGGPLIEEEWRLFVNACPGSGIEKW